MKTILRRIFLFLVGLALVPLCIAITRTIYAVARFAMPQSYDSVPLALWAFALGFLLWVTVFLLLPRPVRTYVLAHELTHALWAWLTGVRVKSLKVSKEGGRVVITRNNILITLAPYFFPLYTMLVIAIYGGLSLFYELRPYQLIWVGLVGFTWSFHVTFTVSTLLKQQSDIHEYGWMLSYTVIYLFNVLGVGLWLVAMTSVTMSGFARSFLGNLQDMWALSLAAIQKLVSLF